MQILYESGKNKSMHERNCNIQVGGGCVPKRILIDNEDQDDDGDFELHEAALKGVYRSYRLKFNRNTTNLADRLQYALKKVYEHLFLQQEESI